MTVLDFLIDSSAPFITLCSSPSTSILICFGVIFNFSQKVSNFITFIPCLKITFIGFNLKFNSSSTELQEPPGSKSKFAIFNEENPS